MRVLDIGCGAGLNSRALSAKGHTVVGVDISREAIRKYRASGFEGEVCDLEKGFPFPDSSFDLVFSSEVIEHLQDPLRMLGESERVLKPGGRFVLSTPNSAFLVYRFLGLFGKTVADLQHPKHLQFFSLRGLARLIREAGFVQIEIGGRFMYAIVPDPGWGPVRGVLKMLGFRSEHRLRTGTDLWHLSSRRGPFPAFFTDTLIVCARKRADDMNVQDGSAT